VGNCDIFVGLLGNRYGTRVNPNLINDETKIKYAIPWQDNLSVTAMEIMLALQKLEMRNNSIFCFRKANFLEDIPKKHLSDFMDNDSESISKMEHLKYLIHQSKCKIIEYSPNFSHVDKNGKIAFKDMQLFETNLTEQLWNLIDLKFPQAVATMDPIDIERYIDSMHYD
jgi:hypothetical protein